VLGITQGVTEFAPVSSSGHLILVPWLFEWPILNDPDLNKTFDVALHMGTLAGALVYFRHDVVRYARAWLGSIRVRSVSGTDERLAWALVVGTIPGVVLGVALEGVIQDELGQPWLIALMLAVFGVVIYVIDRLASTRRHLDDLSVANGWWLGVAQAAALQPGISRSGVTMSAARLMSFDRPTAAARGDPGRHGRCVPRGDDRVGRLRVHGDRVPPVVPADARLRDLPVVPARGGRGLLHADRDRGAAGHDLRIIPARRPAGPRRSRR
jgi:undecaprenyl-diphosphatase UppP